MIGSDLVNVRVRFKVCFGPGLAVWFSSSNCWGLGFGQRLGSTVKVSQQFGLTGQSWSNG
ncbi:hypothetical protein Hanom_Chr09g00783751 [Helianthus anomalus]